MDSAERDRFFRVYLDEKAVMTDPAGKELSWDDGVKRPHFQARAGSTRRFSRVLVRRPPRITTAMGPSI
jgi:hypothetical protein